MFIPDPTFFHPGPGSAIKEFKYFNPQKLKKWFPSSGKYDPGCSSRIPDPDADFLPIQIRNTDFLISEVWMVANCVILVMESNREKN
jgi:hypothetical protein